MIKRILQEPGWTERLTERDLAALSPLLTQHINKYGRFELYQFEKEISYRRYCTFSTPAG